MNDMEYIKSEIRRLYETDPIIHISVRMTHPKVSVKDAQVRIVGVYRNIFQVEQEGGDRPNRYTLQYTDVLIGQVTIAELDDRSNTNRPGQK